MLFLTMYFCCFMLDFLFVPRYIEKNVAFCNRKEVYLVRNDKIAYTVEEAADISGIGRNTIRQLVDWGKLPVLRVGRKILIRGDSLDKFIGLNEGRDLLNREEVKAVTVNVSA